MLARLQRGLVLGLLALAGLWLLLGHQRGWPWLPTLLLALATLFAHAWVLGFEFLLLSRVDPGPRTPRPAAIQLLRAWWGEVLNGVKVFGWRQPFRSHVAPDLLPVKTAGAASAPRPGVLLVHGFVCNRGLWTPWLRRLRQADVPCVAVNLEPVFGDIEQYVAIIDAAVRRLEQATGAPPMLVAHSMGGLAVRAWLRRHAADDRVHSVITIGTPHHGTWLARWALSPNTRQMRREGPWLAQLAADETSQRRARFTCFYSHCDNIVFPAETATLPGADNRHVAGVAHVHLVFQPAVWNEVARRLGLPAS